MHPVLNCLECGSPRPSIKSVSIALEMLREFPQSPAAPDRGEIVTRWLVHESQGCLYNRRLIHPEEL